MSNFHIYLVNHVYFRPWENMNRIIKECSTDGLDYPSMKSLIYVEFLNRFKMGMEINANTHNQA